MKKSKITRIVSVSAAAVFMLTGLKFSAAVQLESDAADAKTAFELTKEMKIGWNLGNTLDSTSSLSDPGVSSETAWGNPKTTQEMIDTVKAKGFNTVRVPTTWYQHLNSENVIDPAWMARVKEVVDYCIADDMYVILNMHHENFINVDQFTDDTLKNAMEKSTAIWTQVSAEFQNYDQHLVFEAMNEARQLNNPKVDQWGNGSGDNGYTWNYVNTLTANFIDIVRNQGSQENKDRLLMIPGYCASSDITAIRNIDIPENSGNVALSVHAYLPYFFTMATDSYANHSFPGKSGWGEDYEGALKQFFTNMDTIIEEKNAPIVIGEFGASNFDNTQDRVNWANSYITLAKKSGIPCVLWDNNTISNPTDAGECHGYLNRAANSWYEVSEPVLDSMMEVLANDKIEWGNSGAPTVDHDDITTGVWITPNDGKTYDIDASIKDGGSTPGFDVTWKVLEGGDVAVSYEGDVPVIAVCDGDWLGWTEITAYDVDKSKGIAYYSSKHIASAWGEDRTDEIAHIFAKTQGVTKVKDIVVIGGASDIVDPPVDTTKKYDLDLSARTGADDEMLVLTFEGAAGSVINGCVGYMGDEWTNIEWDGKIGADGTFSVNIPMSDIPASVTSAQAQIWWCDDKEAEMTEYKFNSGSVAPPVGILYGDANEDGVITIADATAILQAIGNPDKYSLTEQGAINSDVDGEAGITGNDALVVQQIEIGMYTQTDLPLKAA